MGETRLMIVSHRIPPPSLSTNFFSPANLDATFSDDGIPFETLNLSIVKLDASYFRVEVANAATVADLKQAVEAVFYHMPRKGPGKILWSLVWRQFCLSYQGQELISDTDYIIDYGIKDGDQLHFMRHVSDNCNFERNQWKKRVMYLKQHNKLSSQENTYQQKEHKDDDIGLDDIVIENGKIQHSNAEENRGGKSRLAGFWGGLFSHSRLAVMRRARIEGRIYRPAFKSSSSLQSNQIELRHPPNHKAVAMANMIMASSKPLVPVCTNSRSPTPRIPILQISLPKVPTLKLKLPISKPQMLSLMGMAPLVLARPSLAAEIEKAALFDFNLTLPIIMVEFLLLMVALDKVWFTPLGKFMDERDAAIREKLSSVKDTSEEVKQLEEKANAVMAAARAEIAAALNTMKKETQAEVEQKIAEGRKKVEAELQEALASLENQKEETIKSLDSQIAALSQEIVKKVLPSA
ncbi:hypothetical protein Fmac_000705 [Flemingia macrophylla]|uniref:SNRNP25 ubiquitin-like domain-containing protein n=1 Tax=Flemingia macrophylla TaxID=520843 RepID=A0ABD1NF08_9FABA